MGYYIGLDVSQRQTAICIIDDAGKRFAEGKTLTLPSDIYDWISQQVEIGSVVKVGLEAGAMSAWLFTELSQMKLPMLCLETWQAAEFLKTQRNKTDKNDARGLAQLVRMGGDFIRPVIIRSQASQEARVLLTLRDQLVRQKVGLANNITGTLKPFGLVTPRRESSANVFRERVFTTLFKADERNIRVRAAVTPMLEVYDTLCEQLAVLDKQVEKIARANPTCKRLMTAPGVGPITALAYMTAVDDPSRFKDPNAVGAYFGLTPKQYQSGEMDRKGRTSKRGDLMTRTLLVIAANSILTTTKKWFSLKAWGMKKVKKYGLQKAKVAVARKLAILLHRMWINEQDFIWNSKKPEEELAAIAA